MQNKDFIHLTCFYCSPHRVAEARCYYAVRAGLPTAKQFLRAAKVAYHHHPPKILLSRHRVVMTMTSARPLIVSLAPLLLLLLSTTVSFHRQAEALELVVPPNHKMDIKLKEASELYEKHFAGEENKESSAASEIKAVAAPGRVNLIGEHTDYTGGFVLPFAIDYSTVAYGTGGFLGCDGDGGDQSVKVSLDVVSSKCPDDGVIHLEITSEMEPPPKDKKPSWTTYVVGTIYQYLPDILTKTSSGGKGATLHLSIVMVGDVPLGSGLSSSASLEVATARFVEEIVGLETSPKERAIRCQKAENVWCHSPCGIMDQYVSSAASYGSLLLIDCTSLEYQSVTMAQKPDTPVIVVSNSNVQHDIAGGEYPVRVKQCKDATIALQKKQPSIKTLRDATLEDVMACKDTMDDISFRRAKHVVTENTRTLHAKQALEDGNWQLVGQLMTDSHTSMKNDYEVSCNEIDILVDLAQSYEGVYGSRLTGGGFGGCTVTLVSKESSKGLMSHLKTEYTSKTGKDCFCFETSPSLGAHVIELS